MSTNAKKFTYTIRAEYEGAKDIKQLSDDLKQLDRIEVLQGAEKDFVKLNEAFVNAKQRVRELRKEMASPGGDAFAASYAKAREEVKKINTALQQQKGKINEARTSLKDQGIEIADVTTKYAALQRAATSQATSIAARQKLGIRSTREVKAEIAGLEKAYKDLERSGEHSIDELARAKEKLSEKTKKLNAELGKTAGAGGRFSSVFRTMGGPLSRATAQITSFVGAALGLAGIVGVGYGVSRMVSDVTKSAKEMGDMARIAGQSVGDFTAFGYAAETVGISMDKLADMSKDVKDKIGDFIETGGGEFKDFFEQVATQAGITADELIKLSGPDALIAIKKAMDDANVPMENQVFYLEAIANDASLLIPLLAENGKQFKELAGYAKEMGISLSDLEYKELMDLHKVLKEFQDTMGKLKREIVVALTPAVKDLGEYFAKNKDEIRQLVVDMAKGTAELVKFVTEHGNLITTIGKVLVGMGALSWTISSLTVVFGGLQKAASLLSGTNLLPWLTKINVSAMGIVGKLGAIGAGITTLAAGYSIGKKIDEWQYFNSVVGANKQALEEVPEKFKKISEATGVTIRSFDDLNKAQKDGLIKFNDTTGAWEKGAGKMTDAVTTSANQQATITSAKLNEMKEAYQKYADEVKKYQDEIAGREQSLAEQLRAMSRSGMSDLGAWQDRKREAEEYYAAAEKAVAAGDYDKAIEMADKAKQAYADLNEEVKSGDDVVISQSDALKTAMAGVEESGKLAIEVLEKQKQAAAEAADQLNMESGWQISEKQLAGVTEKTKEYGNAIDMTTQKWEYAFRRMEKDGSDAISELERRFNLLEKDRHVKVYIDEVTKKSSSNSTKSLRESAATAFTRYDPSAVSQSLKESSVSLDLPQMQSTPRLSAGMQAAAPSASPITLNVSFAGSVSPMDKQTARKNVMLMMNEIEKITRRRS